MSARKAAQRPKRARQASARSQVARARRVVVKVGSGVLTAGGRLRPGAVAGIARQVARLVAQRRQVVIVSSGAIALGAGQLGWKHPGRSIPEKQAAAAVGQIGLAALWRRCLRRHGRETAQVLLTQGDLREREHFLNARRTLLELLRRGVVPVVNENDTIATEEIRFGDNDNLSATVVNLVGADLLVLLSDVDGLYRNPPQPQSGRGRGTAPSGGLFGVVQRIDAEVKRAAGGSANAFGRGGMITKLQAARSAAHSGAATLLCNGLRRNALLRGAAGEDCGTLFCAGERLRGRKHWLAFTARPRGRLVCDAGAVRALCEGGRSLLPAGVAAVRGRFGIGDAVACVDSRGREFARGLCAYAAEDVERIRGQAARQIARLLGYSNGDEVIHRDDLVLLGEPETPTQAPKKS
ncbi:MAG: glutamate 5-kinase [Deltaproteobacteria bacterium]|nr:glutamate 5-kinase [Deltaproteobacteria bacterium]